MKQITVDLKNNAYPIIIKNGILEDLFSFFPANKKIFLITNDNLCKKYQNIVEKFSYQVIIKDGEENKNFQTFEFIINELLRQNIERTDLIVAFGGGVTGDLAGYAASSVLRGIDFIQIPTTLLAQVDSSVGGKTGFNTKFGKNLVGAFYQPKKVLIDPLVLSTLDQKQVKTGLGEVVKYAFIEKNCSSNDEFYLFDFLESIKNIDEYYNEIIYKSCALKASVVSNDEKEKGQRAVLNFGHTFAHAIETITDYKKYTHGEAVSMGMKLAFDLSLRLGLIEKEYHQKAFRLIDKFNIAPVYKIECDKDNFIDIMKMDKKVVNSKMRLVLPVKKGVVQIFDDIKKEDIENIL